MGLGLGFCWRKGREGGYTHADSRRREIERRNYFIYMIFLLVYGWMEGWGDGGCEM